MKSNLPQQPNQNNDVDFLIGDVICITEAWRPTKNNLYVFENVNGCSVQVSLYAPGLSRSMSILAGFCVDITNIRHATVAELQAKRRLSEAELALAEVS